MTKRKEKKAAVPECMAVTLTAFADLVGKSLPTLRAALRRGLPSLGRQGREHRLDLRAALRWWLEDLEARHEAELEGASDDPAMQAARRRKLEADASLREQQLAIRSGTLIDVAVAERIGFDSARTIRESVLNVPDRIAAELAAEGDEAKVHTRLSDELTLALTAASDRIGRREKRSAA